MDCCVSGEPFGGRHNLITANAIVSAKREHNNLGLPPMLHQWHTHVICENWKTIKKRINYTKIIEQNVPKNKKKSLQKNNI